MVPFIQQYNQNDKMAVQIVQQTPPTFCHESNTNFQRLYIVQNKVVFNSTDKRILNKNT